MSALTENFKYEHPEIENVIVTKRNVKKNEQIQKDMTKADEEKKRRTRKEIEEYKKSLRQEEYEDEIMTQFFARISYEVDNGKIICEKSLNFYKYCKALIDKLSNRFKNNFGLAQRLEWMLLGIHSEACKFLTSNSKGVSALYHIDGMIKAVVDIFTMLGEQYKETAITHKRLQHLYGLANELARLVGAMIRYVNKKGGKERFTEFLSNNPLYSNILVKNTSFSTMEFLMSLDPSQIIFTDAQLKKPMELLSDEEIEKIQNSYDYLFSKIESRWDDPNNVHLPAGDVIDARGDVIYCPIVFHNSKEECGSTGVDVIEFFDTDESEDPIIQENIEDNKFSVTDMVTRKQQEIKKEAQEFYENKEKQYANMVINRVRNVTRTPFYMQPEPVGPHDAIEFFDPNKDNVEVPSIKEAEENLKMYLAHQYEFDNNLPIII